jgi:asparagine synthase (glutamine-hydrolysing)
MLKGVKKLAGGSFLEIENGKVTEGKYYELKIHKERYKQFTYSEAQDKLMELMEASVVERMIADVPLGAFLSGGIDSSVIVALASKHTQQLNTFSIGYRDNPFFDETSYAQLVAKKYNTNHTVFSLKNDDFLEPVYDVLDYLDEPYADSSAIPMYILCKHTKGKVTVALSGDGGDEVFSGYNKHAAEFRIRQQSLANTMVKAVLPLWKMMPRSHNNKITNLFRQLHRFAEGANLSVKDRYWRWASMNTPNQINPLLSQQTKNSLSQQAIQKEKQSLLQMLDSNDFNEILLTDMNLVLGGDMLVKVDMMSMANSLEVRCPFLDYKVVDFAFGLPVQYKVDGKMKKKILQDAFRPLLPPELYNRPKHGFEIPLLGWMRNELWSMINNQLLEKKFIDEQGVFEVEGIEQLKKKLHSSNPENAHGTIWALIVFQHWWKKYFSLD